MWEGVRPLCIEFVVKFIFSLFSLRNFFVQQEIGQLPKPLCIESTKTKVWEKYFNLHNKELTVKPVNRIRKRIRWLQESPTGFLKVFERDEWGKKVKSRSVSGTQLKPRWVSPSWCRGCCALRGKSQDRRRWSAVMGLPSAVHVHSHGRSYTEIAAEWGRWHGYSRRLHLFDRWAKKLHKQAKKLTTF